MSSACSRSALHFSSRMNVKIVQRVLGLLLMVFSASMLPPILLSLWADDGAATVFAVALLVIFGTGLALWLPVRRHRGEMRTRDGFFVVAMFWVALGSAGALPFMLTDNPHMQPHDAVFESVSGLTTTGATVISGIEELPISVRYYRQQLQWLGGVGIIVLAVAILPMLGIGGMQLYRAETPGPVKDAKLTPRIAETAKALWYIYLGLTVACAVAYWIGGMSVFDAICHAFSTLSTGGFSTYDASFGHFNSPLLEMIAAFFMFLGGVNFSLHFYAWRGRGLRVYLKDSEFRFFFLVMMTIVVLMVAVLEIHGYYTGVGMSIHHVFFQVVSFITTTGYATTDFYNWPSFLPTLLLFIGIVGACASSTSGGIKMVRVLLLFKQGVREIMRLIHPQAQLTVKMGDRPVDDRIIDGVWGFFATFMAVYAAMMLLLMAMGLDQVSAFSAVAATIANLGPGLGEVATSFESVSPAGKWLLSLTMIMGRLEVFTVLVLLSPAFWRR